LGRLAFENRENFGPDRLVYYDRARVSQLGGANSEKSVLKNIKAALIGFCKKVGERKTYP